MPPQPVPVLHFCDVSLGRGHKAILSDVSWRVDPGQHWAVVGPNGSGKTTLLRTAMGYLWPSTGTVRVLGQRFGTVELGKLRRHIGWVSSALHDWVRPHERALNVVLSGRFATIGLFDQPDDDDVARARKLLADMACEDLANRSFGLLSQGEQQKVMIARAMLADAKVLILDEPCAGMDLSAREGLLAEIERLGRRGDAPTLILVTHHIEEITPVFTHVLALRTGRVLAQGPKQRVLVGSVLGEAFGLAMDIDAASGRFWPRVRGRRAEGDEGG